MLLTPGSHPSLVLSNSSPLSLFLWNPKPPNGYCHLSFIKVIRVDFNAFISFPPTPHLLPGLLSFPFSCQRFPMVLVFSCCYNRLPQTRGLYQYQFIIWHFWKSGVWSRSQWAETRCWLGCVPFWRLHRRIHFLAFPASEAVHIFWLMALFSASKASKASWILFLLPSFWSSASLSHLWEHLWLYWGYPNNPG